MNFRTKDLMISVVPERAINPDIVCRYPTLTACWRQTITICHQYCSWLPTVPHCRLQCSRLISDVPEACRLGITLDFGPIDCTGTPACAGSMTPWLREPTVEGINELRSQLKARIEELDEIQASFQEGPANLAEAEALEGHLKDALTQVQARKAELRRG